MSEHDPDIEARAFALDAAAKALRTSKGFTQYTAPMPDNLLAVASWVYTGTDPYAFSLTLPTMPTKPSTIDDGVASLGKQFRGKKIEDNHMAELSDPNDQLDAEGRDGPDYDRAAGDEGL